MAILYLLSARRRLCMPPHAKRMPPRLCMGGRNAGLLSLYYYFHNTLCLVPVHMLHIASLCVPAMLSLLALCIGEVERILQWEEWSYVPAILTLLLLPSLIYMAVYFYLLSAAYITIPMLYGDGVVVVMTGDGSRARPACMCASARLPTLSSHLPWHDIMYAATFTIPLPLSLVLYPYRMSEGEDDGGWGVLHCLPSRILPPLPTLPFFYH